MKIIIATRNGVSRKFGYDAEKGLYDFAMGKYEPMTEEYFDKYFPFDLTRQGFSLFLTVEE